jgi:Flp pilus assembly CpaE family ATPase
VVVGQGDPVGLQRLVRGLADLREAVPGTSPVVVVNKVRGTAVPGDTAAEIRRALSRYAGVDDCTLVPMDTPALDAAMAAGRTLAEAAPASPARTALASLAGSLVGVRPSRARKRLLRRR